MILPSNQFNQMSKYTEDFPMQKVIAVSSFLISIAMFSVILIDYLENSKHRKITMQLDKEKLDEAIKKKEYNNLINNNQ